MSDKVLARNWFNQETEEAYRCCESCRNSFVNAEVNVTRGFLAGLVEGRKEIERYKKALELVAGQAGVTPADDACRLIIKTAREALESK